MFFIIAFSMVSGAAIMALILDYCGIFKNNDIMYYKLGLAIFSSVALLSIAKESCKLLKIL